MVTRLNTVVTYLEELPPINLKDLAMTWSCEVTSQIKYISPLTEDP